MRRKSQISTEYLLLAALAILLTLPLFTNMGKLGVEGKAYTAIAENERNCELIASQIEEARSLGRGSQLTTTIHLPKNLQGLTIDGDAVTLAFDTEQGRQEVVCYINALAKISDQGLPASALKEGTIELQFTPKGHFVCVGPAGGDCTETACFDNLDNDGNGCTDLDDSGCDNAEDTSEGGGFCCGNGRLDAGEACDTPVMPYRLCQDYDASYVGGTLACHPPDSPAACQLNFGQCHKCGNGAIDPDMGEECDCGTDGCAPDELNGQSCVTLNYVEGTLGCTASCSLDTSGCTNCGNRAIDPPETCDDGRNGDPYDNCLDTCQANFCGDGFRYWTREECDDGNTDPLDGCDDCVIARFPGCPGEWSGSPIFSKSSPIFNKQLFAAHQIHGHPWTLPSETEAPVPRFAVLFQAPPVQCNDANADNNDDCLANCQNNVCGDGFQNVGVEACDLYVYNSNTGTCTPPESPTPCQLTRCVDGYVQTPNGQGTGGPANDGREDCDDGNLNQADDCLNSCTWSRCGDGIRNTPNHQGQNEECDGTDFGGKTCADYGFSGGTLRCLSACSVINTGQCTGKIDGGDDQIE